MTKNILKEYRDLKKEESEMKHKEWLDNFNHEQNRI